METGLTMPSCLLLPSLLCSLMLFKLCKLFLAALR